jgi:hypothetical protein
MSTPSLAPFILKRPWLQRWMKPLSEWYLDNAGYRKLGLRYVGTSFSADSASIGKRWTFGNTWIGKTTPMRIGSGMGSG